MATLKELDDINKKKFKEAGEYSKQLEPVKNRIRYYSDIVKRFPSSSAEFKDATTKLKEAKVIEKDLTDKRDSAFNESQEALKSSKILKKNKELEDAITKEKENKRKTEALGGDTTESDKKITKLETQKTNVPTPTPATPVAAPVVSETATPVQPTPEPVVPKVPATASAAAKAKVVKEKGKVPKAPVKTSVEDILEKFGIIEAIANQDEEISNLIEQYADGKLTEKGFRQGLNTSRWRSTNSETIRQRKTDLAIYNSLTPEERAQGSNSYTLAVNNIIDSLQTKAKTAGAVIPEDQLRTLAEKLYITGQETVGNVVLGSLKPFIKLSVNPITGAPAVGGVAGDNYKNLVATANANGVTIKELPAVLGYSTLDEALQAIAGGESIATLQQNVRNFRMTGQPDFISAKLAQGIDYATIVSPYRTTAATVLEIDPAKMELDDPAIQLALQNNGMNLFDYKKALKKDSRWQYTENANEEINNKFLRIAQDFGLEA